MKIGIVASRFNGEIVERLLEGARRVLMEAGVEFEVFDVPGAFEIPLMAARLAESKMFAGLIALGVVIKGETDHYDIVCRGCTDGVMRVILDYKIPIAFEVLMVDDEKLAMARADESDEVNAGAIAAWVVLEMAGFPRLSPM